MAKLEIPSTEFKHDFAPGSKTGVVKAVDATKSELLLVDLDRITLLPGFNVRLETQDYLDHIDGLKESIKQNGYFPNKPLGGYLGKEADKDALVLTDGYSRFRALGELKAEGVEIGKIPFIAKPAGQTLEDLTVALVQDNEGRPLSVFERAIVVKRLIGYGVAPADVSRRLGITDRYRADLELLSGAPTKIRNLIIGGSITATEATKLMKKEGKKAGEKAEAAVEAAKAKGKKKATAKDTGTGKPAAGKKSTVHELNFSFKQGQIVEIDTIRPVARVLDASWWEFVDEATDKDHVVIQDDIKIDVRVTLPNSKVAGTAAGTTSDDPDLDAKVNGGDPDLDGASAEEIAAAKAHMDTVSTAAGNGSAADEGDL